MQSDTQQQYPHTKVLLQYLFATYGKGKAGSSPPQPLPPNNSMSLLEMSVRKLALAQSRAASAASSSKAPSEASATTDDEDSEAKSVSSSGKSAAEDLPDDEKTRIVIKQLDDPSIDEDDMPDALKETLNEMLILPQGEPVNLDSLILSLLHRHREDVHPTGNPVPPLPNHGSVTPGSRPSLSRSGSFRRTASPGMLTPGGNNAANSRSPSGSPWSSPKPATLSLNPASGAFKFSVGASEFTPGGAGNGKASPGIPGSPLRARSPMPMTAQQAQQNWALNHSPLSTPKHSQPPSMQGTASAASSPGYFPRQLDSPGAGAGKARIPRLPWADLSDAGNAEEDVDPSSARIDDAALPPETLAAFGGQNSSLYSPAIPIDQAYADQYPIEGGEAQWVEHPDGGGYFYPPQAYPPQGYPAEYAFITLPGPAPGEMPSIDFANQLSGSSGMGGIGAYAMTPFDHLHSIFAGSDVPENVLEDALQQSGFDVDKAIEYIIDQQLGNAPPVPPGALPPPGLSSPFSREGEGRGKSGRVCRFYLAGNCLRADCQFSHDVSKAVCKFWLRGHCLKGDGRCDFLHTIPPVMRADYEARSRLRQEAMMPPPEAEPDVGPELDFPTLGDAPRSRRPLGGSGAHSVQLDPSRTRFAGAVKFGQKLQSPVPPRAAPSTTQDGLPAPRKSGRIALRPPALLPTLPTGSALATLYIRYRQNFLELGANRNKCLAKAAECYKRGDGAGARKWSREAQDWSRQVAIEGRDSALRIVEERKRILKEALDQGEGRAGMADDAPDRKVRGQERGGGICLGVVSLAVLKESRHLTEEERTEVAIDLHALHTDEAISFMGDFLLKLEAQNFQGLAFVVIGQQKHSGSSAPDKGEAAGRLRLEQATTQFLSDQGWAWQNFGGILAIDCLR
ncbi:hypothetical protein NBRC10512v2_005020 [Rhodotorula toruloides]